MKPAKDPTTTSLVPDQSTADDTPPAGTPFAIGAGETTAGSLMLSAHPSNQGSVSDANFVFGGSGPDRTLTLAPEANQSGTATITITVADPDGASASRSFVLTVNPVNDPPTISIGRAHATTQDTPTAPMPSSTGDEKSTAGSLTVTAHSFNQ